MILLMLKIQKNRVVIKHNLIKYQTYNLKNKDTILKKFQKPNQIIPKNPVVYRFHHLYSRLIKE